MTMVVSTYFTIPTGVSPTYEAYNPDTTKANVSISGDTLTIDPKTHGDTGKVIITASADGCDDVTRDFNVNVAAAPSASECPAVKQTHPSRDVALTVGGSDFEVNLNDHFTNLASNGIDYAIESSNSDVATASRTDTTLTISPGIAGTAQVTITVSRCGCETAVSQVFNVTVDPQAPAPGTTVASVTVSPASASVQEGETQQFTATAHDSNNVVITGKTFIWTSSDTSVATINSSGLATAVNAGSTTITATTDDVPGTASLTVTEPDPCPAAIADAPIPDQTLIVGAGTTPIDLTQHFEHIDQDGIEISVTSPSPGIATAVIEGTSLKIDPVAAGQIAAIAVTVTDTAESDPCDPVSQSFMVTVEAALEHPGLYPWSVSGEHVYRLNGNVGIGVEVPDQKLVVDGTVKAEGYRLRMIPADYVFEEGYDLLSLDEVASYIRNHGHLPGVASGAEMKANGLGISRMQTTLLEKIEELSLYIIAQHEQLREQGDHLAAQQQKLEIQKTQASELEQRLRRWER
ncbi:MAG: hypothetical protein F4207_09185 [Gemmatimonadetes bacterium]|nr:hypothetical protein [Gemmatimonadota bacterium]